MSETNRFFLIILLVVLALYCFLLLTIKRKEVLDCLSLIGEIVINGIIVTAFVILLCARTGAARVERSEILLAGLFYGFVVLLIAAAGIIRSYNQSVLGLPLVLFFLVFQINSSGTTFQESNTMSWTPETCYSVSRDIVSQLREADRLGAKNVILDVPLADGNNWPFAFYGEQRYAAALYEHGIISHAIETRINPSEEFNEKYGLFMDD